MQYFAATSEDIDLFGVAGRPAPYFLHELFFPLWAVLEHFSK